ncbi:hypothetical protein F3Y22_tig00112206pilonHSYRG00001 [Hibiscus syriacus]|uniref:Uncharacterized protein n=1 Tax=Hibiscus syriacus TaxID=106335 RepID=A0A6A2X4T4_HIBSY|nr:hypothetical protein F3Y22_tig00112206pilonHSYRG00001 [Hibiscus syriacus]
MGVGVCRLGSEYGPDDNDLSLSQVFGSQKGKQKATTGAVNGIARLQALQFMRNRELLGWTISCKATDAGYQRAEGTSPSESASLDISDHKPAAICFSDGFDVLAACMLTLKGLEEQGRLGRSFGKVTIRDQPPSNTIQKIIAVKDGIRDVEYFLQNPNATLLKLRTILLAGQPQITTEVALVFLTSATILLIIPFKSNTVKLLHLSRLISSDPTCETLTR